MGLPMTALQANANAIKGIYHGVSTHFEQFFADSERVTIEGNSLQIVGGWRDKNSKKKNKGFN